MKPNPLYRMKVRLLDKMMQAKRQAEKREILRKICAIETRMKEG